MELKSIQFKGVSWKVFRLSEKSWLLNPEVQNNVLELIHETSNAIESARISTLIDLIPAYDSLTLVFNSSDINIERVLSSINQLTKKSISNIHEINVCYNMGLDWEEMESVTGLKKKAIISIHSSKEYTIAMMGFLPGFVFLEGLDTRISASRKSNPRIFVPKGSVGIGGNQTGIYSLESPGGWQIIGKTSQSFFNVEQIPPTTLQAGDKVRFIPISKEQYLKQESHNG